MSESLTNQRLKRVLRSHGVRIHRLVVDVSDERVVVSGEVGTYYEVQLIQIHAKEVTGGRELVLNVSIVPSVIDLTNESHVASLGEEADAYRSRLHRVRNQLNELCLATRLLDKVMGSGDIDGAKKLLEKMVASTEEYSEEPVIESSRDSSAGISSAPSDETSLGELKLLVVEDDEEQGLLLSGMLRHLHANVARASDADAVFRVLNEGFVPDIVLLDMHMPQVDGADIARALKDRRHCENTKIIAVSGTHPEEVGLSIEGGDVHAWLPKPINVQLLLQTIHQQAPTGHAE